MPEVWACPCHEARRRVISDPGGGALLVVQAAVLRDTSGGREGSQLSQRNYTELEQGLFREMHQIEAVLAEALGYTHDKDYGWVVGDHTTLTLADELAHKYEDLKFRMEGLEK